MLSHSLLRQTKTVATEPRGLALPISEHDIGHHLSSVHLLLFLTACLPKMHVNVIRYLLGVPSGYFQEVSQPKFCMHSKSPLRVQPYSSLS
jgi:hypothetical protein